MSEFAPSRGAAEAPEGEGESQAERIAWLRKRGVQIEIPGERRPAGEEEGDGEDGGGQELMSITVVRVPANDSEALEEMSVGVIPSRGGDQLLVKLRRHFSGTRHDINTDKLKESAARQFGSADVEISPSSLQRVSELGCVECFTLDSPSDANGLQGVHVYLDEAGQLKGLAPNKRASALAKLCGFESVPFVGDVFLGRTMVTRDGLANASFPLRDVDSSAAWLANGVAARNYELGAARGAIEMVGGGEEAHRGGKDASRGLVWTETDEGVEVQLTFPAGAAYTSKQLNVKIASRAVTVTLKAGGGGEPLLSLRLKGAVSPDDSTWTVAGGVLEVTLEKTPSGPWGRLEE